MMEKRINFDHGHGEGCGCSDCTGGNANSYFDGIKPVPNLVEKVPVPGPSGKNSLIIGSVTDGTNESPGTDDTTLLSGDIAKLLGAGLNVTTDPTIRVTPDPTDTNNTKVFVRESNKFLKWVANGVIPFLLPNSGDEGDILRRISGIWTPSKPTFEIYNTTSTTSFPIEMGLIGTTVEFTVDTGLAYTVGQQVWATQYNGGSLTPANYIVGVVTGYNTTTLSVSVFYIHGSGTPTKWLIGLGSPLQLPYFDASVGNGQFLFNNGGNLEWRISALATGFVVPWHNPTIPDGFLPCDGSPFTQAQYPALFQHLRPAGAATKYSFQVDGITSLGTGNARTPAYNQGAVIYGVDGSVVTPGTRAGSNEHVLLAKEMPVNSPYGINDPGHAHTIPNELSITGSYGSGSGSANSVAASTGATGVNTTGITPKPNTIAGGQTDDGGQPIDMMQLSEGAIYIIKT